MSEQRKLTASEDMMLTNGDIYGSIVYLGVNDSAENWYEITQEEYFDILAQREAEMDERNIATEEDYRTALRDMGVNV